MQYNVERKCSFKFGAETNIMIKVNLPNPREMSIEEFFAQMRIALKSAEKSYQEIVKGIELNADNQPWISFRIANLEELITLNEGVNLNKALIDDFICEDDSQELYLEIERL